MRAADTICNDCGDVNPRINMFDNLCSTCYKERKEEMSKKEFAEEQIRKVMELGYTEDDAYDLMQILSPRYIYAAVSLACREDCKMIFLLAIGARKFNRIRASSREHKEDFVRSALACAGVEIPHGVDWVAFLKCVERAYTKPH